MGRLTTLILMAASFAVSSGCICGAFTKRDNELCCPTDVRKTHYWCFGEDAIIHGPCGPKPELYGYEPTCWREFPSVPPCYCTGCDGLPASAMPLNQVPPIFPTEQLPPAPNQQNANPFNGNMNPVHLPATSLPEQGSIPTAAGQAKVGSVADTVPGALTNAPKRQEPILVDADKNLLSLTPSRVAAAIQMPQPSSSVPVMPSQPVLDEQFYPVGIGSALTPAPLPKAAATDEIGDGYWGPDELSPAGGEGRAPALQQADGASAAPLPTLSR